MADSLWPWLALAGLGALHGANPVCGWPWAAARGLGALRPIAAGHLASVAIVAGAVALGVDLPPAQLQWLAGCLLLMVLALRFVGPPRAMPGGAGIGKVGLALGSFIASTAHGAGLMLVPALVPLCVSDSPAREITASGSWALALAAVTVHAVSMFATAGALARGTRGLIAALRRP